MGVFKKIHEKKGVAIRYVVEHSILSTFMFKNVDKGP